MNRHKTTMQRGQQGVVLIVALVVVLVLSIIGMAAIRGSGLQELMAGNMRDQNVAFLAAETGLRAGEADLTDASMPAFLNNDGYYTDLGAAGSVYAAPPQTWTEAEWTQRSKSMTLTSGTYIKSAPRYILEKLDFQVEAADSGSCIDIECTAHQDVKTYYRVTSRASGLTSSSVVILQSTYSR